QRFLGIMDRVICQQKFLLGGRPSSADFGIYAQLTQLAKFDPTPAALCMREMPRVHAWTDLVDDLSGHPAQSNAWLEPGTTGSALTELLTEIGRTYAPALLANAAALQQGEQEMITEIDGQRWQQPTFPYQAKCLQWINAEYQALDPIHQQKVNQLLAGTGCAALLLEV
ncbi:MAG: glutathione S-transferase domain-containing protein, partial [Pseudomonadota bacterium]